VAKGAGPGPRIELKITQKVSNLRGSLQLNSRLLNFVFLLMNGTSHISVFELNLLPTPVSWLPQLADTVDKLSEALAHEKHALWSALDRRIYDFYGLTKAERERVDACVP
jgi:hypothetical protein